MLQERLGSEERAERFYDEQMLGHLNARMREFVRRQEMFFLATSDGKGECDNTFRAGSPGFLQVLDDRTVAYPEYRGNGVFASLGNIEENPHVALLLLDFQQDRIGLHINGRARVVADDDMRAERPSLPVDPVPGRRAVVWVEVTVDEAYVHCSKHIPHLAKVERAPHGEGRAWGTDDNRRKGGDYFGTAAAARARRGQDRRGPGRGRKQDPRPASAGRAPEPHPQASHASRVSHQHQQQSQAPASLGAEARTPAHQQPQDQPPAQQQPQHQFQHSGQSQHPDQPPHADQPSHQGQHQHPPAVAEQPWDQYAERWQPPGQDEPADRQQSRDQPLDQRQPWEPADFSQGAWDRPTAQLSRSQLAGQWRPQDQVPGRSAAEPTTTSSPETPRGRDNRDDLPPAPPTPLDARHWDAPASGTPEATGWPPPPPLPSDPPSPSDPSLPADPLLAAGPPSPPWPPALPSPAADALAPPQPPYLPQPPPLPQPAPLPQPPLLPEPPAGTPNLSVPAIGADPDQRRERGPSEGQSEGQAVWDEGRRWHGDQDRQVWQETVERVLDRARQPLAAEEGEQEPFAGWFVEPHSGPKPPLSAPRPATDDSPAPSLLSGTSDICEPPHTGPRPSGPHPA
ncbi:pyridoxamine 5'-phosphate oxidase family protein [Streptomyces sp. 71268]|uniref:pyridoxamine 5'-phosphate oxidase family protein n=1 Tax=Streptomyces sp. 71268 TaxID=3002640 RepID=UPI0023F7B9E7|nr:pyridoxamine 5'-phosphate oxidase family protein [Streptomyces sp. 71268]WEV26579.1 pyridoxamine 5'-phosphate oxidase family protein [Streptomyces sp. 71268]